MGCIGSGILLPCRVINCEEVGICIFEDRKGRDMDEQRIREIFAEELDKEQCRGIAERVRGGYDNSPAGTAAIRAMKRIVEICLAPAATVLLLVCLSHTAEAQGYVCRDYYSCRGDYWRNNYPDYRYARPRFPGYIGRGPWRPYTGWGWRRNW